MSQQQKQASFFVQDPSAGAIKGPLTPGQLKAWYLSGEFSDWGVAKSRSGPWTKAGAVKGLKGLAAARPEPAAQEPTSSAVGIPAHRSSQTEAARETVSNQNIDTRICPSCAERIKLAAVKCRFCGEDLGGGKSMKANPTPLAHDITTKPLTPNQIIAAAVAIAAVLAIYFVFKNTDFSTSLPSPTPQVSQQPGPVGPPASTVLSDEQAARVAFEDIVSRLKKRRFVQVYTYFGDGGSSRKDEKIVGGASYSIDRTTSLVAPYVAKVTYTENLRYAIGPGGRQENDIYGNVIAAKFLSEVEAVNASQWGEWRSSKETAEFKWQDGKWVTNRRSWPFVDQEDKNDSSYKIRVLEQQ